MGSDKGGSPDTLAEVSEDTQEYLNLGIDISEMRRKWRLPHSLYLKSVVSNEHEINLFSESEWSTYPPEPIPPALLRNALTSEVFQLPELSRTIVKSRAPIAWRVERARRS